MIRLLLPADFALYKAIRLEAVRTHPPAFGSTFEEDAARPDQEWADRLGGTHMFAYLQQETPIGIAAYYQDPGEKNRHRATGVSVYVTPHHRGKGILDWLLGTAEYHARDHGAEQLHLAVGTYNESALRAYERNGFRIYGTEPRALKVDGRYIDEYVMVKYL